MNFNRGRLDKIFGDGLLGAIRKVYDSTQDDQKNTHLSESDLAGLKDKIWTCIKAEDGEIVARSDAADIADYYLKIDQDSKLRFMQLLAEEFDARHIDIDAATTAYKNAMDDQERLKARRRLTDALKAPRLELLTRFTSLDQGVKFLVDFRADILKNLRQYPELASLDEDLKNLFLSWFDFGFLDLKRITWRSSADLLEKLIAYEAVHEIESWSDLKNRLDNDRRCFALFHPRMPNEPLAFVEVALTDHLSGSIQKLLDESNPVDDPEKMNTAIFYSISNTQAGLRGIAFGEYLIKQVVKKLNKNLPNIQTFATLSPMPGFRPWATAQGHDENFVLEYLDTSAREKLSLSLGQENLKDMSLGKLVDLARGGNKVVASLIEKPLCQLSAEYLTTLRDKDQCPVNAVARFHMSNGARLERLNWMGDSSENGLGQSYGMMVNYGYIPKDIDHNYHKYREKELVLSRPVRSLLP